MFLMFLINNIIYTDLFSLGCGIRVIIITIYRDYFLEVQTKYIYNLQEHRNIGTLCLLISIFLFLLEI